MDGFSKMIADAKSRATSLPLCHRGIISTNQVDEAEQILSRFLPAPVRIDRLADRKEFRLDMNGSQLKRMFLGFNAFGTETDLDTEIFEDAVALIFGWDRTPASCFEIDDQRLQASANRGVVVSPGQKCRIKRPRHSEVCVVGLTAATVTQRYLQLTGRPGAGNISFTPGADLRTGVGRQIRALALELAKELDRNHQDAGSSLIVPILEDSIVSLFLALHNSLSDRLAEPFYQELAPWMVRRAEEYMEANAAEPISLSDLVALCRCSESTLFQAFRSSRGYTPMQFLASRRLDLAHQRLMSEPNVTSTSVALDCGFGNHGRFTKAYQARYGETPSATMRRCHGPRYA